MKPKSVMAQRLQELRKSRHLTQEALARALGISSAALKFYENSMREPNSKAMAAIEKYFGVTGAYLRGEEDIPAAHSVDGSADLKQLFGPPMDKDEVIAAIQRYEDGGDIPVEPPAPCRAGCTVAAHVEQVICVTINQIDHDGHLTQRKNFYSLDGRLLGVGCP